MPSGDFDLLRSVLRPSGGRWPGGHILRGGYRHVRRKVHALRRRCGRWWPGAGREAVAPPDAPAPGPAVEVTPAAPPRLLDRAGGPRIPSHRSFRVLFVLRPGVWDAASMRYRGYNVIEALRLVGIEAAHLDDRHIPRRLAEALSYDLIVLVRRQLTPELTLLLDGAGRHSVPVICDFDDYVFDDEVIPYIEMLRRLPLDQARGIIGQWRDVLDRCRYFTGSSAYLTERAAALGKESYPIRNGLNEAQVELSRLALGGDREDSTQGGLRLGYFSGTRTHQADFRQIAGVLVRLMDEFPTLGLLVAGDFDLTEFPEFGRFPGRVEGRPFVDWRLLPAEIARVDINLVSLELNTFTEGKSNLKYYEAALLKIPTVASPSMAFASCITHGVNGFLAHAPGEWYESLRALVLSPGLRQDIGERAYRHALREYNPGVIADEAVSAYRKVLLHHRSGLGIADDSPTVVVLMSDLERALRERSPVITLSRELVRAGASLMVLLPGDLADLTALQAEQWLADDSSGPSLTVQVGGEVPCCDILLATDSRTAHRAKRFEHRAGGVAYLVSEYEPAHLPAGEGRDQVQRSYQLGLKLLALDPTVVELIDRHHDARTTLLPAWVESRPLAVGPCHDPSTVLMAATGSLPDPIWSESVAALDRIHADHPDVRIVLCGDAALRGAAVGLPYWGLPRLSGQEFESLLAEQPVGIALYSTGRPLWIYDLMAAGCPVVAVASCVEHPLAARESTEGFVTAHADADSIAFAIESLLIDRIRLSRLTLRAADRVRSMPEAREAALALLRALDTPASSRVGPLHRDERWPSGPFALIA